jgi:hypothetical protein
MNKNWFYRVLALALVAMLAVPMFAFAEEDVLATAAEAPAEELATALEGDEDVQPIAKRALDGIDVLDVYLGYSVVEDLGDWDINDPQFFNTQINLANSNGGKESFKSSNKKVATVSPTGLITLVGVGRTTITCTGYVDGKKKTTKFLFDVKDPTNPTSAVGHFYQTGARNWGYDPVPYADTGSEEILEANKKFGGKDGIYIGMGFEQDDTPTVVYEPVPFNSDSDWVGPGTTLAPLAGYTPAYTNGYQFKHSNAKVMFFDGNKHDAAATVLDPDADAVLDSPVDDPFKASAKFWTGPNTAFSAAPTPFWGPAGAVGVGFLSNVLVPVFYKSGTNKLTIKTMATAGLKSYSYSHTFEIPKEKVVLRRGTDKQLMERAKYSDAILYQLDTIDIQSMDKVVLTIKVYNGTSWAIPVKDVVFAASAIDSAIDPAYAFGRIAGTGYINGANIITTGQAAVTGGANFTPFLQKGLDHFDGTDKTKRNGSVKGTIKPKKQTTITITFENERNGDFDIKSLGGFVFDASAGYTPGDWTTYNFNVMNNIAQQDKKALEIMSPYPNVWDAVFGLSVDLFYFDIGFDQVMMPIYAF